MRSLIGPFLLGFGIITFLLTMEMILDLLNLIIGKGIDLWTVTRLFVLALGWMVALSFPCGILVSALMTYGRLSQDNEIIALRASGVHLLQIIWPTLGLSVILAVALTLFNNYVLPEANYAWAQLIQEVNRQRPTAEVREGVLIDDFKGYDLWIGSLDDRTGAMRDVLILDSKEQPQAPRTILAERGTLTFRPEANTLTLELADGEMHELDPASPRGEYRRLRFDSQVLNIIDVNENWGSTAHERSEREMSIPMMKQQIRRLRLQVTRQDSLLQAALNRLPPERVVRLRHEIDPPQPGPVALFVGFLRRLGRTPSDLPPEEYTAAEESVIELAKVRARELRATNKDINDFRVEIHKKFSIPFACIVFVLLGAPLGIMARRGGLAAGFFSAIFFVFYYLCLMGGEQLADRLILEPWFAMWIPNIILGLLGIYLTRRAILVGNPARVNRGGR